MSFDSERLPKGKVKITDDKGLPIHPLYHAITTKFYLCLRHQAMNLVQFTITAIN